MKALLTYTSKNTEEVIDVNTLEDLIDLQIKSKHSLVINTYIDYPYKDIVNFNIEVYDGWRE